MLPNTQDTQARDLAMNKAKINLMSKPDSAFFTSICFSLKQIWDDRCPTAYTDGRVMAFNTKFFMDLSPEERVFLLVHESQHIAYDHIGRCKAVGLDMPRYNRAADYVINLQQVERGYKMPACGLLDHQYAGMSTEEVYKLLQNDPDSSEPFDGQDLRECDSMTDAELSEHVKEILVRAAVQSKMSGDKPGTIPGDIQIYLDNLLNPKLPWHQILRKYLQAFAKNDYSWRKFNRRFFPKHHMPGLHGERLIDFVVAVDTSGSVSDEDFKVFVSEVHGILRMMQPEKITLIQFDTALKSVDKVRNIKELMDLKFTGRGGTLITPVLEWANTHKPQLLMVFSDGEFNFYDTSTKTDTLWMIHNNQNFKPPFGKVIHYSI